MAGITQRIVSRRKFDFAGLAGSQTQTFVVHRGIDVSMYREATLEVAVHVATLIDSTHTVQVLAYPVILTDDEPQTDFVASAASGTVLLNTTTQQSQVVLAALSANFGGMLQIQVKGTQPAGTAAFTVTITIDISLKE
jgi:hypothetical protein